MTNYISFVGYFDVLPNEQQLTKKYKRETRINDRDDIEDTGYLLDVKYQSIGGKDSLTVYLADLGDNIGHLVADCSAGGWCDSAFVRIQNGEPVKSELNFNPNPVEQVI